MHFSKILQIFGGLVLGCIKTKFCKKICVRQQFSSSTRFASFCTAAISNFSQKIGLKNCEFRKISENFRRFWQILLIFEKKCDFGAVQRSAFCRSRRELSNAYLLAKFGFDTAENEPSKVCRIPWQLSNAGRRARRVALRGPLRYEEFDETWQGSFSAVSRPNFARKYAFESSRRDLHNALLRTALKSHLKNARILPIICEKIQEKLIVDFCKI